ncbi:MAG TPA: hypothetical protein PK280_09250 [Planctomycetota bacterium]|nr:hypothetical protein [Planctomycetota bacterium]
MAAIAAVAILGGVFGAWKMCGGAGSGLQQPDGVDSSPTADQKAPKTGRELWERELRARQIPFRGPGEDGYLYAVLRNEGLGIKERDLEDMFSAPNGQQDIIELIQHTHLFSWRDTKDWLFCVPEETGSGHPNFIGDPGPGGYFLAVYEMDREGKRVEAVRQYDLERWGVSEEAVKTLAREHTEKLLDGKTPEIRMINGVKTAVIPVPPPLRASAVFTRQFKSFISKKLDWPVAVCAPNLSVVCVVSLKDLDTFDKVAWTIMNESTRAESGGFVTRRVLIFSDDGVKDKRLPCLEGGTLKWLSPEDLP